MDANDQWLNRVANLGYAKGEFDVKYEMKSNDEVIKSETSMYKQKDI